MDPKPVAESRAVLSHWIGITDANSAGRIHGGTVMKLADEVAALAAIKHSRQRVVTAGMDRMNFLVPIYVTCQPAGRARRDRRAPRAAPGSDGSVSSDTAVTSVAITHRIESVAPQWDDLVDRVQGTPFQRPGWIQAWWDAFGSGSLEIMCAWRGPTLAGVLPVVAHRRRLRSPTNPESFEFGPVAESDEVTLALARALLSRGARRISLAHLDGARTPVGSWQRAADETGYRLVARVTARSPSVVVQGDWPAYEAGLGKGFRSDLKRCRRRLAERGEVSVSASDRLADVREGLSDLLRLEAAGWKGQQGTAIASRPRVERFYRSMVDWAAQRGSLRLFALRLDGRAVAVLCGLQEQGALYAMKAGYDPQARRFSPGKLLLHAVIEDAFSAGLTRVELLGVDDPYKRHWATASRESLELDGFDNSPVALAQWLALAHGRPLARRLGVRRVLRMSARSRAPRRRRAS